MKKIYSFSLTDQETFENIFTDEKILMNHVVVPPGKVFPKHPTDATVYALVVKGELSVITEEEPKETYKAGSLVNISKGVNTELGNKSNELLELFVVKHDYE